MQKLHKWVKYILGIGLILSWLNFCFAQPRFDFGIHKGHFLSGEYSTTVQEFMSSIEYELTFKDGCKVKYNSMNGVPKYWRWSKQEIHGKLM